MLIDADYFNFDVELPANDGSILTQYITRYENQIINDLFGYELGKLIIAYDINDPGSSDQRIRDIVEGKEYTISNTTRNNYLFYDWCYVYKYPNYYKSNSGDITIKWNGLINTEKISLIAYWVAYWWYREHETFTSNAGNTIPNVENSIQVGFGSKGGYVWHKMLELYGWFIQPAIEPSCFNFMWEHSDTYPEWVFKSKESTNMFGI